MHCTAVKELIDRLHDAALRNGMKVAPHSQAQALLAPHHSPLIAILAILLARTSWLCPPLSLLINSSSSLLIPPGPASPSFAGLFPLKHPLLAANCIIAFQYASSYRVSACPMMMRSSFARVVATLNRFGWEIKPRFLRKSSAMKRCEVLTVEMITTRL